ncbi:MAG: hypothetical protein IPP94_13070 [Ignavibacteria bacterium]|nr:hypothetical protein [Ignavibacteria bacterium]
MHLAFRAALLLCSAATLGLYAQTPSLVGSGSQRNAFDTLAAPVLLAPANGAKDVPVPTMLRWSAVKGATLYHLQISPDSTFAESLLYWDYPAIADTVTSVNVFFDPMFEPARYWRVCATDGAGKGPWSNVLHYEPALPVPDTPRLIAPRDESVKLNPTVSFGWYSIYQVSSYEFSLSRTRGFVIIDTIVTTKGGPLTLGPLQWSTRYYWRVRAYTASGFSSFSPEWSFTTKDAPPDTAPELIARRISRKTSALIPLWSGNQ